jgi:hypothetical protein
MHIAARAIEMPAARLAVVGCGMADQSIKPGQRFREAQAALFGRPAPEWAVQDVFMGGDGVTYARVVLVSDPSNSKTLSTSVLGDRHRFVPGSEDGGNGG